MIHRYSTMQGAIYSDPCGGFCLASEVLGEGTWFWAIEQMKAGKIVRHFSETVGAKYRMSTDGQHRIEWSFGLDRWETAKIFLSDIECADWECTP